MGKRFWKGLLQGGVNGVEEDISKNIELKIKQKRTEGTPGLVLIICIHTLNESIKYSLMFKSRKLLNLA